MLEMAAFKNSKLFIKYLPVELDTGKNERFLKRRQFLTFSNMGLLQEFIFYIWKHFLVN